MKGVKDLGARCRMRQCIFENILELKVPKNEKSIIGDHFHNHLKNICLHMNTKKYKNLYTLKNVLCTYVHIYF